MAIALQEVDPGVASRSGAANVSPFRAGRLCLLLWLLLPLAAPAHGPWECSVRVIAGQAALEVAVTAGEGLAGILLERMHSDVRQLPAQQLAALPVEFTKLLCVTEGPGGTLAPVSFGVIGDGLEYLFVAKFPAADGAVTLNPGFLGLLPTPSAVPLLLTDEVGNVLTNAAFTPEHSLAQLTLPARPANPKTGVAGGRDALVATAPVLAANSGAVAVAVNAGDHPKHLTAVAPLPADLPRPAAVRAHPDPRWAFGLLLILPLWWIFRWKRRCRP